MDTPTFPIVRSPVERVPVVYIAGPFRAKTPWLIEQNVRRAEAVALEVWKLGAAALCPHANTRHFQNSAKDEIWMRGTMELLRRCDAIVLLKEWKTSEGSRAEVDYAFSRGLPVFNEHDLDVMELWIAEWSPT
jgi:hypothetical protein